MLTHTHSLSTIGVTMSSFSFKNKLQEHHQKHRLQLPCYTLEHSGTAFLGTVEFCRHGSRIRCSGETCSSKKSAEQSAAQAACAMLTI